MESGESIMSITWMDVYRKGYTSNMSCPNCGAMWNQNATHCLDELCLSYYDLCMLRATCNNCNTKSDCYLWIGSDETEAKIMAMFHEKSVKKTDSVSVDQKLKEQLNENLRKVFG